MDWTKTTARRDEKHLSLGIWCDLHKRFDGMYYGRDGGHPIYKSNRVFDYLIALIILTEFRDGVNNISCNLWWMLYKRDSPTCLICQTMHNHLSFSNKIWWLCLVPTSTTRFGRDVGYRVVKHLIGKWFLWTMTSNSLTDNEERHIPSQILKTIFGLHASVIF